MKTRFKSVLLVVHLFWASVSLVLANGIEPTEFRARRQAYAARTSDGVTVLFNSLDEDLQHFHTDKNFHYLTGVQLPDAILVLSPGNAERRETLFLPERNLAQEKWTGPKLSPGAETAQRLGIDRVLGLDTFQTELTALMSGKKKVYAVLAERKGNAPPSIQEGLVSRLRVLFPFAEFVTAATPIAHLRMTKSPAELTLLKQAIQVTIDAHQAASAAVGDGRHEYEVQATLEYVFRRAGASGPAFPSIVGSGPNSVILHYDNNSRQMHQGEVVVVDIGAEFDEYAADVTRTYPVAGKFSSRQREIYDIVLGAQEAALREVKPGVTIGKSGPIHRAAYEYIDTHGKDLKGNSLGQYFIHGTSHHLGLDVHDAVSDTSRILEPGMVITVEPGIYIPDENIGIRIEDVVLITETGYELLTRKLPRTPDEIEKLMVKQRTRP